MRKFSVLAALAACFTLAACHVKAADSQAVKDQRCGTTWSQSCYLKPSLPPKDLWNTSWTRPDAPRRGQWSPSWRAFQSVGGDGNGKP